MAAQSNGSHQPTDSLGDGAEVPAIMEQKDIETLITLDGSEPQVTEDGSPGTTEDAEADEKTPHEQDDDQVVSDVQLELNG